ncbi:MerR family transcriptional regulator [Tepidiphilus olei]|uniref:MerR family transcriptional regulator n=1 Tax=Tepidiphilus olei TaxID=2502184 RepID=UPI00115CF530|nr:MerR family transcriptional regulator [Tepidiphilus olei]
MEKKSAEGSTSLPPIPSKRYFTIGEVAQLCDVKPHVLRYWEQEFTQLRPSKRAGNRRYYQHHEVLLVRRIRHLLYDEGYTIAGARQRLGEERLLESAVKNEYDRLRDRVQEVRADLESLLTQLRS